MATPPRQWHTILNKPQTIEITTGYWFSGRDGLEISLHNHLEMRNSMYPGYRHGYISVFIGQKVYCQREEVRNFFQEIASRGIKEPAGLQFLTTKIVY